jgi:hypothetical protein
MFDGLFFMLLLSPSGWQYCHDGIDRALVNSSSYFGTKISVKRRSRELTDCTGFYVVQSLSCDDGPTLCLDRLTVHNFCGCLLL